MPSPPHWQSGLPAVAAVQAGCCWKLICDAVVCGSGGKACIQHGSICVVLWRVLSVACYGMLAWQPCAVAQPPLSPCYAETCHMDARQALPYARVKRSRPALPRVLHTWDITLQGQRPPHSHAPRAGSANALACTTDAECANKAGREAGREDVDLVWTQFRGLSAHLEGRAARQGQASFRQHSLQNSPLEGPVSSSGPADPRAPPFPWPGWQVCGSWGMLPVGTLSAGAGN